ncbi:MAG: M1 family metallopeptidase [Gemmatimonadales bacterium]
MRNAIALLLAGIIVPAVTTAQTRPAPTESHGTLDGGGRPLPGPVYEESGFSRAVVRGTRTRTGLPAPGNWVQHARYEIDASLDASAARLTGRESVVYLNNSPDTLRRVAVYLRQNAFAPGAARRDPLPVTGGVALSRVEADGRSLSAIPETDSTSPGTRLEGTVLWIRLPMPLGPSDSVRLGFEWSFTPPPSPSDGRQGRESDVYFLGYWYPQMAVYDDLSGWVTDPYLGVAEFYMDPADYDVRLRVPKGWVVGATGTLEDSSSVLSRRTLDRLAQARRGRDVVHVISPEEVGKGGGLVTRGKRIWHFSATGVRDFAWGAGNHYAWDAATALVADSGRGADTVAISSFFRISLAAAAWQAGGARFTRDAIERMSAWLWPYPWPQMTSMEGVLTSGGMEYPMMTLMQPWADTLSLAGDLMHETGHMWFPMQVGSNETRHPWMDEGLTQFDVAQGMRVLYGEPRTGGRPNDSEQGQRELYLTATRAGLDAPLMQWGDLIQEDRYFTTFYDKTAQVLAALRGLLGEEPFHRALREYGKSWTGRHPDPADFFNTFARVSGGDLSWFWVSWFYEAWPLDQAVADVRQEGDSATITVEDRGLAPMPVRLAVTHAGGQVERVEIPVGAWLENRRSVSVRVRGSPAIVRVEIDPEATFPDLDRSNQIWEQRATSNH